MALHREAYQQIANDAYMTAPALLIAFLAQLLRSLNNQEGFDLTMVLLNFAVWIVVLITLQIAALILRGKANFGATLRVAGFAQSAHILELLGFIPVIGPVARFSATLISLIGIWIGTATAHQLKGWRTLLLPVVYLIVFSIGFLFLMAVFRGTEFAIESLLLPFGLLPPQ
jgi:hypothetical protein